MNMKKYITIILAVCAAALFIAGCDPQEQPGAYADGLTLSLYSGEPETRAVNTSFETKITHFDFFFFKDAEGTTAIRGMHERVTGSTKTLDTQVGAQYEALRKGTSYVYILANYPETIDHSRDWTLQELLALPVNADILKEKKTAVNPITGEVEETGEVVFCSDLVMDSYSAANNSYTTKLTPRQVDEQREVTIGLSRLAAKLSLEINVAGSVTFGGETWTPMLHEIKAYYVNALNNLAKVNGVPVRRDTIAVNPTAYDYVSYPTRYPLDPNPAIADPGLKFTLDPVYTYPQTWESTDNGEPYFKIQLPWMGTVLGSTNVYYKVVVPKPASGTTWTLERNTHYKVSVNLTMLGSSDDYVEVVASYTVTPWSDSGFVGGVDPSVAKFFDVPVTEFEIYSDTDLSVPFSSSSAVQAYFTNINYKHYKVGSGVLYNHDFTDNPTSVTLPPVTNPSAATDPNPYTLSIVGNSVKLTHNLNSVYTVRNITFVIENLDGRSATVTVHQHPAIEVKSRDAGTVFVNGHFARALESVHVNGDPTKKLGVGYVLQYNPGRGETRYHSDDTDFTRVATSDSDETDNNTYWYQPADGYAGGEHSAPLIIRNVNYGRYGYVEGDVNRESALYMVEIIVSAFSEANNTYTYYEYETGSQQGPNTFVLGDPRVEAGNRFTIFKTTPDRAIDGNHSNYRQGGGYLYQSSTVRNSDGTTVGDAVYKAWTRPEEILIASTNKLDGRFIAPHLLLSSFFNAQPGALTHEECLKRAATYQEAGYPAGRWRLPTEAEIMFMVQQQQRGVLPRVWAEGSSYWCADGRYVKIANDNTGRVTFYNASSSTKCVNRFVYDLWYWGDEPMSDTETYWADMHLVKPNNP